MTEAEWLACTDPMLMLEFLRDKASDRKLRLLLAACCRRVEHLLGEPDYPALIAAVERVADGKLRPATLARYRTKCPPINLGDYVTEEERWQAHSHEFDDSVLARRAVWLSGSPDLRSVEGALHYAARALRPRRSVHEEAAHQCHLVHELIGNPFRPVATDPRWLTPTATSLAEGIYADRAFDRLPILADALEEAGCDNIDIPAHCRSNGPHVRGCWVVDAVLGKV